MLKQLLLLAFGGLLVIVGLLFAIFAGPWWKFLGVVVIVFALLVILFTIILRRVCGYRHCIFITFIIISLGILLVFTGVAMTVFQPWIIVFGIIVVFIAILIIALGILLAAEC